MKSSLLVVNFPFALQQELAGMDTPIDTEKISEFLKSNPEFEEVFQKIKSGEFEEPVVLNKLVDILFENLNTIIRKSVVEPVQLPEFQQPLMEVEGSLKLENGTLKGVSTMGRKGDVSVELDYPKLNLHASVGLSKLTFSYAYQAELLDLSPAGIMKGQSVGSKIIIDFDVDLSTLDIKVNEFLLNLGDISVEFKDVNDEVRDILKRSATRMVSPLIENILQNMVPLGLARIIDAYYIVMILT